MNTGGFRAEEARRKSQERLAADRQRGAQALKDRDKAAVAEAAKTQRLRALRLAKEAADKETADRAATNKAAAKPKSPRQPKSGETEPPATFSNSAC
jgi:hypothetical protein